MTSEVGRLSGLGGGRSAEAGIARSRPLIAARGLAAIAVLLGILVSLPGCGYMGPENPAVAYSAAEADGHLADMARRPVQLQRPVVVLAGYQGPESEAAGVAERLARSTSGNNEDYLAISYPELEDLDEMAALVVERVEERWPSPHPAETVEVDAVVISLGGLVSRWATAAPEERAAFRGRPVRGEKRLRVRRIYSIVSPHRGVDTLLPLNGSPVLRDLNADSEFIRELDRRWPDAEYTVLAYGARRDSIVDPEAAAPPGQSMIWIRGSVFLSHWRTISDLRIHADIARRLRGETPLIDERAGALEVEP